jgi:Tol biopolymer transport system component
LVVVSIERDGTRALRILDEQGREVARLGHGYHRITEPSWSPDGRSIAYAAVQREGQPYQLFQERIPSAAR